MIYDRLQYLIDAEIKTVQNMILDGLPDYVSYRSHLTRLHTLEGVRDIIKKAFAEDVDPDDPDET
jgi:hypothetical protein